MELSIDRRKKGVKGACILIAFAILFSNSNYMYATETTQSSKIEEIVSVEANVEAVSGGAVSGSSASGSAVEEENTSGTAKKVTKPTNKPSKKKKRKKKPSYKKEISRVKKSLKKGTKTNVSVTTGLSKKHFLKLVKKMKYDYKGVFRRNAEEIYDYCHKEKVNELFVLGIIAEESGWGKVQRARRARNYTGQKRNGQLIRFATEEKGLKYAIKNLGRNYLSKNGKFYRGKTIKAVNKSYCGGNWDKVVLSHMKTILKQAL